MLRKTFVFAMPLAAMAAAAMMMFAQAPAGGGGKGKAPAPAIVQIKPGLYEVTGLGGNISVRVGSDAVLIADTGNLGEENYTQLIALVKTVTQLPVRAAVVTHIHQDHSGNTASFVRDGVPVWAHDGEKALTATYQTNGKSIAPPSNTFAKTQTVTAGSVKAELYNFGPTHTGGDTIVYFPDLKVIHGGDMIVSAAPNCDYPMGGSVTSWAKAMDEVLKLDFDTVIPGHGNPMTKADVQAYAQKWKTFVQRAADEVKKGTAKDALVAAIKVDDLGWNAASYNQPARIDLFIADLQNNAK
jgi:cyclase